MQSQGAVRRTKALLPPPFRTELDLNQTTQDAVNSACRIVTYTRLSQTYEYNLMKLYHAGKLIEQQLPDDKESDIHAYLIQCLAHINQKVFINFERMVCTGESVVNLEASMKMLESIWDVPEGLEYLKAQKTCLVETYSLLKEGDLLNTLYAKVDTANKDNHDLYIYRASLLKSLIGIYTDRNPESQTPLCLALQQLLDCLNQLCPQTKVVLPSVVEFKRCIEQNHSAAVARKSALNVYIDNHPYIDTRLREVILQQFILTDANDFDPSFNPFNGLTPLPYELQEILRLTMIQLVKEREPLKESITIADQAKAAVNHEKPQSSLSLIMTQAIAAETALKHTTDRYDKKDLSAVLKDVLSQVSRTFWASVNRIEAPTETDSATETDLATESERDKEYLLNKLSTALAKHKIPRGCTQCLKFTNKLLNSVNQLPDGFISELLDAESLDDKYQEIIDFEEELRLQQEDTGMIKLTEWMSYALDSLKHSIITTSFTKIENKLYEIGGRKGATLDRTFSTIDDELKEFWPTISDELAIKLQDKLKAFKLEFRKWALIWQHDPDYDSKEEAPLFSEVHAHKFITSNPRARADYIAARKGIDLEKLLARPPAVVFQHSQEHEDASARAVASAVASATSAADQENIAPKP